MGIAAVICWRVGGLSVVRPGTRRMAVMLNSDSVGVNGRWLYSYRQHLHLFSHPSCSLARPPASYPPRPVPSPQAPHGRPKLPCSAQAEASASRSPYSSKLILSCPPSASTISVVHLALLQMSATSMPMARYVVLYFILVTRINIGARLHLRSKATLPTSSMRPLKEPKLSLSLLVFLERCDPHIKMLHWS